MSLGYILGRICVFDSFSSREWIIRVQQGRLPDLHPTVWCKSGLCTYIFTYVFIVWTTTCFFRCVTAEGADQPLCSQTFRWRHPEEQTEERDISRNAEIDRGRSGRHCLPFGRRQNEKQRLRFRRIPRPPHRRHGQKVTPLRTDTSM